LLNRSRAGGRGSSDFRLALARAQSCARALSVTGEPAFSGLCHCRNSQRHTRDLKSYNDTGDSGQPVHRRFSPNCGSGVIADVNVLPVLTIVLAGTLDDPSAIKPTTAVYCSSAQPWLDLGGERTRIPKMTA
jgi:hypothetical protein